MKFFFLDKLFKFAGRKLDGYKTLIGGAGLILTGVIGIAGHMFPDQGLPQMDLESAIGTLSAGLVALGLGGKAEKLKKAVQEQAPIPTEPSTTDEAPQG